MSTASAFIGTNSDTADLTTYTFVAQDIGAASAGRHVVVGISGRAASTRTINSVTIGGVSAVQVGKVDNAGTTSALWIAHVPTGATADIVIVLSAAWLRMGIGVWTIEGLASITPFATANDITGDPVSATCNIPARGSAFAIYYVGQGAGSGTVAWTGLTERFEIEPETGIDVTGASDDFVAAVTPRTITADASIAAGTQALFIASFGPSDGDGASAGVATAAAVGEALASGVGASAGVATVTAVGVSDVAGSASAAGVATAAAVGVSEAAASGSSSGVTTSAAVSESLAEGVGSSNGLATVSAVGETLVETVGTVAGASTASAVGASDATGVGSSSGVASTAAIGAVSAEASGSAAGASTAAAVAEAAPDEGDGLSAGVATVSAVGESTVEASGLSAGSASVSGVGSSSFNAVGSAAGSATVSAVSSSTVSSVGSSAGTSTALAISVGAEATGLSAGLSTALAVGASVVEAVGVSAGRATTTGFARRRLATYARSGGTQSVMSRNSVSIGQRKNVQEQHVRRG